MAAEVAPAARVVGKKQLCEILGWSRSRLDRRLDADPKFPVSARGGQAGGWAFDVAAVEAYLAAGDPGAAPASEPEAAAAPARAAHLGEETARQRLNTIQAQLAEDKLRERRGELVNAAEVKMALAEAVTRVSTSLNSMADVLVRRLNLPESAGPVIRQEIDQARRQLVHGLREFLAGE